MSIVLVFGKYVTVGVFPCIVEVAKKKPKARLCPFGPSRFEPSGPLEKISVRLTGDELAIRFQGRR